MKKWLSRESLKKNGGFTLIELIVSMAVGSMLMGGLLVSVHQLLFVSSKAQSDTVVVQQTQNLSYWISRDVQMTQTIGLGDVPATQETEVFTFTSVGVKTTDAQHNDYFDTRLVRYLCDNSTLSRYELIHTDVYNSNGALIDTTETTSSMAIAEHISNIEGSLSSTGLRVSVTVDHSGTQIQRAYDITPRANVLN